MQQEAKGNIIWHTAVLMVNENDTVIRMFLNNQICQLNLNVFPFVRI